MDIDFKNQAIEAFNTVQTNISFLGVDKSIKTLMVTSSIKGEGKSTVSSNVANSYAFAGKRVLLVDCDMRNPTVHRVLNLANREGLSELIMHMRSDHAINNYVVKFGENFDVVTAGHRPPNPTELLGSEQMKNLLQHFMRMYDYVILDTPPVLIVPDAIALSKHVDGIVQVVRHGYTTKEVLEDAKKAWEVAGTKPTACILNCIPNLQKMYSYYGYYDYVDSGGKSRKSKHGKKGETRTMPMAESGKPPVYDRATPAPASEKQLERDVFEAELAAITQQDKDGLGPVKGRRIR